MGKIPNLPPRSALMDARLQLLPHQCPSLEAGPGCQAQVIVGATAVTGEPVMLSPMQHPPPLFLSPSTDIAPLLRQPWPSSENTDAVLPMEQHHGRRFNVLVGASRTAHGSISTRHGSITGRLPVAIHGSISDRPW